MAAAAGAATGGATGGATGAGSAATGEVELRRLGGASVAVALLLAADTTEAVRHRAALALANASQSSDNVCRAIVQLPNPQLKAFVALMASEVDPVAQSSVARCVANCSALEDDDVAPSSLLYAADALTHILTVFAATTSSEKLQECATTSIDNLVNDCQEARIDIRKRHVERLLFNGCKSSNSTINECCGSALENMAEHSPVFAATLHSSGVLVELWTAVAQHALSGVTHLAAPFQLMLNCVANAVTSAPHICVHLVDDRAWAKATIALLNLDAVETQEAAMVIAEAACALVVDVNIRDPTLLRLLSALQSTEFLVTVAVMLDHTETSISTLSAAALRCLCGQGELPEPVMRDALGLSPIDRRVAAFVESGSVQELHRITASSVPANAEAADWIMSWIKTHMSPELLRWLTMSLATEADLTIRTSIAVGLFYLSFGNAEIQEAFLSDEAVGCVLGLLRLPSKRAAGMEFLKQIQPIIYGLVASSIEESMAAVDEYKSGEASMWSASHINQEKHSDLTLIVGPKAVKIFVHKAVLKLHSAVVASMTTSARQIMELPRASDALVSRMLPGLYNSDYNAVIEGMDPPTLTAALHLCTELGMSDLQLFVSARLASMLSDDTITDSFEAALACADLPLTYSCFSFLTTHFERVAATKLDSVDRLIKAIRDFVTQLVSQF